MSKFSPREESAPRPIKESFKTGSGPKRALNANIDAELHKRFKKFSADDGRSMTAILEEALVGYLDALE